MDVENSNRLAGREEAEAEQKELERRVRQRTAELEEANRRLRQEIQERQKIEKVLQESERRYRLLAEHVTDVIWTMDLDLRLTYLSPSVTRLRGYSVEEAMGQSLEEILTPSSLAVARKVLAEELARERRQPRDLSRSRTLELELRRKDGSTVWSEINVTFLRDLEGQAVGILGITRDISARKRAEEQVRMYQEQLRSLLSELLFTEERERRGLARDLHDSVGQALAIAKLKLDELHQDPSGDLAPVLQQVRQIIAEAIQQTRSMIFKLSPPSLYELGLEAALQCHAEQMRKLHGLTVSFEDDGQPKPLSEDVRVLLFRAVQELLFNVVRHAGARNARISITRKGETIRLSVADDGKGFDAARAFPPPETTGGFGLFSIRERLHYLGGHMRISSEVGRGTVVTLVVPLDPGGH